LETARKFKILIALIIMLVFICAAEGVIIGKNIGLFFRSGDYNDFGSFSSFLKNKFNKEQKNNWNIFDRFFDNEFFSQRTDPFGDMERFRRHLEEMMEKGVRGNFGNSWDSWFNSRFLEGDGDITIDTNEKKDSYVLTLKIPKLKENRLKINIDKDGILVSGEFTQIAEEKDSNGNVMSKHEMHRTISRKISIPPDADHERAQVENKGDKIIITLPKLST
jgi:HSP20 family molecular chaperone IbpA